jgi:L-threonylcarbamoyladenylate synthase
VPTVLLDETLAGLDSVQAAQTAEAPSEPVAQEQPQAAPRSPGMKYAHYAPRGAMVLVSGDAAHVRDYIQREVAEAAERGEVTGVLTYEEHQHHFTADEVVVCGSLEQLETAAQGLYAALREFDARGVERIWAEACPSDGIGLALMNRLVKAAANQIVYV